MTLDGDSTDMLDAAGQRLATRPIVIRSEQMLTPEGVVDAALRIEDDRIVEIGDPPVDGAMALDARGLLVAPALVDMHGDAFERQMTPRPGVAVPLDVAALDTDRQLAASGIATAYHALTLSWEPGLRSVAQGAAFIDALEALEGRLGVEHRIQLRWETFAFEARALIARTFAGRLTPSLAFNDHTSMTMRPLDVAVQDRAPDCDPLRPAADAADPALASRIDGPARRAGLDPEAYRALLAQVWARRDAVDGECAAVAAAARAAGAPLLSHDDNSAAIRTHYRALGARIAEFPMTVETARAARAAGDLIVFGAPNALRGGSHLGSPGAGDMAEAGLCDALASDYYYPAMLGAAARLTRERRLDLPRAWSLISAGPAKASGLHDRGALAAGLRADVVIVDWRQDGAAPAVRATISAGRIAHLSGMAPA